MHPFGKLATLASLLASYGCTPPATAPTHDAPQFDAHVETYDAPPPSDTSPRTDAGSLATSLIEGPQDLLFVGNSYIFVNDVPAQYEGMAAITETNPLRIERAVTGGYRLAQHATDARTDGTEIARWLRTGSAEDTHFDVVILQEQSQIGGFPEDNAERVGSLAGASMLASLAREKDIDVVLYLTWGRQHGDEMNPALFADFNAMQDRLDAGYLAMAAQLRTEGSRVRIAPVGAAFRVVHDQAALAGDPTLEGTAFDALYESDGSHPSARGAYLAAAVILATVTGQDPRTFGDPSALDSEMALREAAHAALVRWHAELP